MRLAIVDTLTTIVFFTVAAGLSELLIAGMAPGQVLITRLLTIPMMVLTGRPYAAWRDLLFRRMAPSGRVGRTLLDIGAFLTFQVPVYAATLWVAGADLAEMSAAIGSAILFMILLSRPFGLLLDGVRRWAGVDRAIQ
ncbi:L-alanine exporter AlaE [Jannaschia sp. 2305UL9-9]|uniref:L-alanine exporter AlaE n=1 Tax=Jannaschia sp. 2305UL9-9 TaxID=3121638 RepID=UPI0035291C0C